MNTMPKALTAATAAALIATPILAQERQRVSGECRTEIIKLCGMDRSKIRACLRENFSKLSESCGKEVRAIQKARQEANKK